MAGPCARRSPLSRSGLTQAGRRRAELLAGHFRIDEREIPDLILFGQRYAKHIRFYEAPRKDGAAPGGGDWSKFFESDVSANLAALATLPVESFVAFQRDLEHWLKAEPGRDPQMLSAYFKLLFHLPLALLQRAGVVIEQMPPNEAMHSRIGELARRELAEPIRAIIGWYKGATEPGALQIFPDEGVTRDHYKLVGGKSDPRLRLPSCIQEALLDRKSPREEPLSSMLVGGIAPIDWASIWANVKIDDTPYRDGGSAVYERIYDALEYNLMESAVRAIYRAAARLKRDAEAQLRESLEQFGGHEPHFGLWLAFLRLFRHAQQSLNGFTERHLDFYFRDVLGLGARAPVPDRVHLLFELAKSVEARRIPAGTAFRAGNDALGRPVSYALEQDFIVNRGSVAALYGIRVDSGPEGEVAFASTELRSLDGNGELPLPPDHPSWPAFGPAAAPTARIGFAVADRKLFLREGARKINLRAEFARRLRFIPASDAWRVRLTGPDGWWEPAGGLTVTAHEGASAMMSAEAARERRAEERSGKDEKGRRAKPSLEFTLGLSGDAPPIIPFDPALHGEGEGANGLPRIEILFDFERASAAAAFEALRGLHLRKLTLAVEASGLRQLSVVAGSATVDPAKPFAPFGPQPRAGAALIIGSSEIFSKSIATWSLTLDWQQEYEEYGYFRLKSRTDYRAAEAVLKDGRWQDVGSPHRLFGEGKSITINLDGAGLIGGAVSQPAENPGFGAGSVSGFVRLGLSDDFGHLDYPAANARALVKLAKGETQDPPGKILSTAVAKHSDGDRRWHSRFTELSTLSLGGELPLTPYDPVVTRIEAAYSSTVGPVERFAHLHPFGELETSPRDGELFPVLPFEGALLIGVADFVSPARLSLLVQLVDGSGDPLKSRPKLRFDYLAGDSWQPIQDRDLDDKTDNLSGSGLIGFAVPTEADRHHRVMPDGLHWLRISAASQADAFNRLLSIDAQAARAVFVDAGNDPEFLATPLPAMTISKLAAPDPAVKKIRQPFSSFGGRPAEAPEEFATRVSERLRHKDRAIAAFDYEALILEAFPHLYRAKCLSTTAMVQDAAKRIVADNEVSPGAVTVVVVPWTHGINSRDPLRPYADQSLLTAVDKFFRTRVSPFVRLEVRNPKFEEVQAALKVRFLPDIADIAFHIEALNAALVEFLTPWSRPGGGEIMFGGRLWKSSLIDFVEEQPEIDFVTDFQLYHKPEADGGIGDWTPVDVELIEATTARSILVSAPRHMIVEVADHA